MKSFRDELNRVVIIGNSGSGKSYFAKQVYEKLGYKHRIVHFDQHFWEPGGFNIKRPTDVVHAEIRQLSKENLWIMEGVFGDLAATALENATSLIFLNKSWDECKTALLGRGSESSKQWDPIAAEKSFQDLLLWAEDYSSRENSRSLKGHRNLYSTFTKTKFEFRDRQSGEDLIKNL